MFLPIYSKNSFIYDFVHKLHKNASSTLEHGLFGNLNLGSQAVVIQIWLLNKLSSILFKFRGVIFVCLFFTLTTAFTQGPTWGWTFWNTFKDTEGHPQWESHLSHPKALLPTPEQSGGKEGKWQKSGSSRWKQVSSSSRIASTSLSISTSHGRTPS